MPVEKNTVVDYYVVSPLSRFLLGERDTYCSVFPCKKTSSAGLSYESGKHIQASLFIIKIMPL